MQQRVKVTKVPIRTSVKEALCATRTEVKLWKKAICKELRTLEKMKTWSPDKNIKCTKNILTSHIVLKIKRNDAGHAKHFTARVVAGRPQNGLRMRLWSCIRSNSQLRNMPTDIGHWIHPCMVIYTRRCDCSIPEW